jgi:RNase P subunit RPR2
MSLTFDSCRICLEVKPQNSVKSLSLIPIDLGSSYAQLYQECIGLHSININDHLPSYLCFNCEKILLKFHKFRLKCLKTEDLLNGLLAIKAENQNQFCSNDESDSMDEMLVLPAEDENKIKQESEADVKDEFTEILTMDGVEVQKPSLKLKIKLTKDEPYTVKKKLKRSCRPADLPLLDNVSKRKIRNERESRKEICQQCGKMIAHRYMKLHLMTHIGKYNLK